jgi:RES domain
MPAFKSANAYNNFARAVIRRTRYIRESETNDFLDTLLREAKDRVDLISADSFVWRAQLGHGWEPAKEGEWGAEEIPGPFPPDRMKPLQDRAHEGRANPKGIAYLYVSTNRDTALAEVRPWMGELVSVAQFRVIRELRVLNCTEDSKRRHFFGGTPPEYWDTVVWCDIDTSFSRPVTPTNEHADYVPTQIIAELFKVNGFDGVAYRSTLGAGHNIVLFDVGIAHLINCSLFELKGLNFDFRQCANPYFIREVSDKSK